MKKVSFPYMGTSYIPFERLLKDFGNKVIVPPRPTEETISYELNMLLSLPAIHSRLF